MVSTSSGTKWRYRRINCSGSHAKPPLRAARLTPSAGRKAGQTRSRVRPPAKRDTFTSAPSTPHAWLAAPPLHGPYWCNPLRVSSRHEYHICGQKGSLSSPPSSASPVQTRHPAGGSPTQAASPTARGRGACRAPRINEPGQAPPDCGCPTPPAGVIGRGAGGAWLSSPSLALPRPGEGTRPTLTAGSP